MKRLRPLRNTERSFLDHQIGLLQVGDPPLEFSRQTFETAYGDITGFLKSRSTSGPAYGCSQRLSGNYKVLRLI